MTSTRMTAAAVGLLIVLPAVFYGGVPGVVFLVVLAGLVAHDEYARMAFPDDNWAAFGWLVASSALAIVPAFLGTVEQAMGSVFVVVAGTMVFVTLRPGPELTMAADRVGRFVLGIAWVGLLTFCIRLRMFEHGIVWVLLALAISWLQDTGAYFAGRRFGKRKMYPRVSPKKTWEGLAGGVATAIAGVFVVRAVWLPELSAVDAVVLGAGGAIAGVLGDLAESLLKRSFDVKDSGWILPGHGGMLDRIDSVLFVAPLVWAWMALVRGA